MLKIHQLNLSSGKNTTTCVSSFRKHAGLNFPLIFSSYNYDIQCRQQLAEAIQSFLMCINKRCGIERLSPMPLCNFLSDSCQPYDNVFSKDYEVLLKSWSHLSDKFKLKEIRSAVAKDSG